MRWFISFLALVAFIVLPILPQAQAQAQAQGQYATADGPLAIANVTVVPMDEERVISEQTVVIRDGRIAEMGDTEDFEIPEDAYQIDGTGRYLMPGLAEWHGHLPGPDNEDFRERALYLFAANGITYVRGMQGAADHPELRDAIAQGERFGPRLLVASPGFGGGDLTEGEARRRVQRYAQQGYDLLKIFEGLDPAVFDAIADEAHQQGIPFGGHVSDATGLMASLEAGHNTVDHLDNYIEALRSDEAPDDFPAIFGAGQVAQYADRDRLSEVVQATAESGAGVVPTMLLWHAFFGERPIEEYRDLYPEVRYIPENMLSGWEQGLENIRGNATQEQARLVREMRIEILQALHEAGVPVLLGSDAPQIFNVPGFSTHREMQYMQDEVGMSPYDVLVTGTRGIAEFYGEADDHGTVAEGMRADLILVRENPLDDVHHAMEIEGVVVNGQWLSRGDIDTEFERIAYR